uniref:Nucleoside diphosphate kinase n=1 Tax=Pipistrellus kuhlii TaxID=59472 RepID=A0A7J7T2E1_PIPKU|nr:NME/NM23 nucleoside diphosphate kinase 4 [Pipistrellus kuhlii]
MKMLQVPGPLACGCPSVQQGEGFLWTSGPQPVLSALLQEERPVGSRRGGKERWSWWYLLHCCARHAGSWRHYLPSHRPSVYWGSLSRAPLTPSPNATQAPETVLAEHYHDLRRKPFYPALISYMSSGPMVAMVWEGPNVVCTSRAMIGHTDSAEAAPGTIRGDFSFHISRNVIHASDSVEGAQREIQLWFQSNELVDWADEGPRSSLYTA